jgi:CTP synthase (UTP-ammonia lyase)
MTTADRQSVSGVPPIALVGDYSPEIIAHEAIPRALELAGSAAGVKASWRWFPTEEINDPARDLAGCAAVWVVPGSPYANMRGALDAIGWARKTGRLFLGTCGGFQHALIEFARNVAGLIAADHAESNAHANTLVVTQLACPLVEKTGALHFASGCRLQRAFASTQASEVYHCSYGLNAAYRTQLENAGLCFSGFDDVGEVRAFELPSHPFFIGTLFQPERSVFRGEVHPLIRAFVQACQLG